MAKNLVIVESPAKAKTINKYLGKDYLVKASIGHIKDLPSKGLGVDVEHNFEPTYELIPDSKKRNNKRIVAELKKAAKEAEAIYLAADPDREGEAICQHLAEEIVPKRPAKPAYRVMFNEITKRAVNAAFEHPRQIDANLVDAQQARRVLDRLVGYKVSPLLCRTIGGRLSAGRVQSVALRMVVEREREIEQFIKTEYWTIGANLSSKLPPAFDSRLLKIDEQTVKTSGFDQELKKNEILVKDQAQADDIVAEAKQQTFVVNDVTTKERKRNPVPPFITSKLQQEASRKLGFAVKRTMMVAQKLYEGVELGDEPVVRKSFAESKRTGAIPHATADGDVAEVVDRVERLAGAGEFRQAFRLVEAGVDAAADPVDERVPPFLIEDVSGAEHFPFLGPVDLDRVVHAAAGKDLHVAAVRFAREDTGRLPLAGHLAVFVRYFVSVPPFAPIDAAVGAEEAAVHVGRIAGVAELADQQLPLIGHAVVVEVGQFPDAAGGGRIDRAVMPEGPLREGHFVGEDRLLIELAVPVGVFQSHDAVGKLLLQIDSRQIHPRALGHIEPPFVVKAGHDGMLDQRRGGGDFDGEAGGDFKGGRREDLGRGLGGLVRFGLVGECGWSAASEKQHPRKNTSECHFQGLRE